MLRRTRTDQNAGFSLAELIVVTAILAILSASAVPLFRSTIAGARERNAVNLVVDTTHDARAHAVARGHTHRLYVYPESGRYELLEAFRVDGERIDLRPTRDFESGPRALPESLAFRKPRARFDDERAGFFIAFYPSGASDIADLRIERTDNRWKAFEIAISGSRTEVEWLDD